MMVGANPVTGVSFAGVISQAFVSISNATTFPLFTFWSAGIVNFFVPSGGGQWAVQAPIMLPAAQDLGVSPALTAMSIAWGDAWTNLLQPFGRFRHLAWRSLSKRYYGLLCSRLARIRCYCFRISACGRSAWIVVCQNA